jgi:RNA recognition motif-containing protein
MNVVKIRGLNYNVRYEEIHEFFKDFKIVDQSVVLGLNREGRKNGFGAILFDNEEEANKAALDLNKAYIRDRFVELSVVSYDDYVNFNPKYTNRGDDRDSKGFCGQQGSYIKLYQCVNKENLDRALVLRGLPYRISVLQLQTFLEGHDTVPADQIFIEEFNGKRTGSALVVFQTAEIAQAVKAGLQKQEMEGRYIELFDQDD